MTPSERTQTSSAADGAQQPSERSRELHSSSRELLLSDRETRVLLGLLGWLKFRNYPPTVRELARSVDMPLTTVVDVLRRLRQLQLVTWEPGRSRTLRALVKVVAA